MSGFANYYTNSQEASKPATSKQLLTNEQIKAKTFKPSAKEEKFRIIPISDDKPIDEGHFHQMEVNGHTELIYCPKHNDGKPCPICDKYDEIVKTQNTSNTQEENFKIYKDASVYKPKKFFILKLINKGIEKDGIKFYRFKSLVKKIADKWEETGFMATLFPSIARFEKKYNTSIYDVENGADITINCTAKTLGKNNYFEPTSVIVEDQSPLSTSKEKVNEWVNDPTTWRDVFRPKTLKNYTAEQYLQAVLINKVPKWDYNSKSWVLDETPVQPETKKANESLTTNTAVLSASDTDDLPF